MLERDRLVEIVVAVLVVGTMVATMYWVGTTHGSGAAIDPAGGELLVTAIVGFVIGLGAVGVGLAYYLNDPEDGLEEEPVA